MHDPVLGWQESCISPHANRTNIEHFKCELQKTNVNKIVKLFPKISLRYRSSSCNLLRLSTKSLNLANVFFFSKNYHNRSNTLEFLNCGLLFFSFQYYRKKKYFCSSFLKSINKLHFILINTIFIIKLSQIKENLYKSSFNFHVQWKTCQPFDLFFKLILFLPLLGSMFDATRSLLEPVNRRLNPK